MASEILSNLQLGSLIFNATKTNPLSATSGAFISAPAATVTDSTTAASGTLSQFNAHFLAAPTLAATNTGVTTTSANTLTIGGAPTAGANETLAAAYAFNVLTGSTNLGGALTVGGPFSQLNSARYSGRWNLNTATSLPSGTPTAIASAASQWTLTPGFVSNNASQLLNSVGGITFPVKGSYSVGSSIALQSSTTMTDLEFYFGIAFKAGGFSDRVAWVKNAYSASDTCAITISENLDVSAGDMLYVYVYQASNATNSLHIDATGNSSTSLPSGASSGTTMSCRLNHLIL